MKKVKFISELSDVERYILIVSKNGQILSSTTNKNRASLLRQSDIDNIRGFYKEEEITILE